MTPFDELVDDFLDVHWAFAPIDASFAGEIAYDGSLPPCDLGAPARHAGELRELMRRLDAVVVPADPGARLDARLMRAHAAHVLDQLAGRSRFHNPAWYTGEIAFGLIALLLPRAAPRDPDAFARRVALIPDLLADAAMHLRGTRVPADWTVRARKECAAIARLLGRIEGVAGTSAAVAALRRFEAAIAERPDADPAAGEARMTRLIRDVHGLDATAATLERDAAAAFAEAEAALAEAAERHDPAHTWREQIARLGELGPAPDGALPSYRTWHDRALRDAEPLLTPASDYALEFALLPEWARDVAGDLYFLFYRSPAARRPGNGSIYWVSPPEGDDDAVRRAHNTAAVKLVHAVHHGSIGHHTQNARARRAASRLSRIAGTDCASGIMMLAAGTMVEGWACYAEDLLEEVPEFYTPAERVMLRYFEFRNIACCLADLRLHLGVWTLEQMRAFYRDEVAFAPARIWNETTRNAMFPTSRLMYWTGTQQIKTLRARSRLPARVFHDRLLSFGSVPVAWIDQEVPA
ncbi:hypothetical protein WPS_33120 [Vulcanimicrobium alpinum]|uniref:DUF885 domain-containing protein n=1 Tax=Vulcanimicrobium alpinum TaxID=3016050 RepID=A0AAN2CBA6_UNVUL|nr:DUF885 family protein [Vulcanimicrobium alpinum]BDE08036.1 hypothetical protein WPS_33120 [Vulcanimicrobium alpinum]